MISVRRFGFIAIAALTAWAALPGFNPAPAPRFVAPPAAATAASPGASPLFASAIVNLPDPPRVHAASVAVLPDGRLFATWFGGEREGGTEVKVYAATRNPGEAGWGRQHAIATPEQTSADVGRLVRKMGNPVAFVTPHGELWVVYVSVTLGGWATSHLNLLRSPDLGATWLPARRLAATPFFNLSTLVKGFPVFFDNGDVGLPVYHEMAGKFAELLVLSDEGEVRRKVRMDHGRRSLQPVVLVEDEQRAVALMRYGGEHGPFRAWRSETADGGRSWSAVEPTTLANPNSALAALRLDDGRLLAVANDTEDERLRLSLLVSEDGGRNWRSIHRFEDKQDFAGHEAGGEVFRARLEADVADLGPGPAAADLVRVAERNLCRNQGACGWQYDYPYLVRAADGDFHLVYTWNRSFVRHIQFNRAWLEGKL
ncbi:sialidase [Azoarcus olearius]|uniref:sialidase family protein n=1 Tax=Azoarcus sp. (strain BH72) TaxID=418699 RepID=UPI00080624B1|nr:sialidase family protein [Azoarcus olearius]ANQ83891.1 sialidase [Azoarcus olearius]